jgi:hypothetical protein
MKSLVLASAPLSAAMAAPTLCAPLTRSDTATDARRHDPLGCTSSRRLRVTE